MDEIQFTLRGKSYTLSRKEVLAAMKGVEPERIRSHAVEVGGREFPVKQVIDKVLKGVDRLDVTSSDARRILGRLGFKLARY